MIYILIKKRKITYLKKISDRHYVEPCDFCYFSENNECKMPKALDCGDYIFVKTKMYSELKKQIVDKLREVR